MAIEIRPVPSDRLAEYMTPICTAFGLPLRPEAVERVRSIPELDMRLGAYDGETICGAAGSYTFEMTVPGGVAVETAGLTMVAVVATHRRRGVLRSLMRRHLDEARARGQVVAALYASEGSIYGRFGYGLASVHGHIDLPRERTAFAYPVEPRGDVRFVSEREAEAIMPAIYERVRRTIPGMLSRSAGWWSAKRIADPEWMRGARAPLQRAVLAIDGRDAAYALYRLAATVRAGEHDTPIEIAEVMGDSPAATRAMWRWVLDVDVATRFVATHLPPDHPLVFLLLEPRKARMTLGDALWVRLVDVGAALGKRGYAGDGAPLVIEVEDAFCPWNAGRFRLAEGRADRTSDAPDLALDVATLGAAYLGGFGLAPLASAGRVLERTPGALRRADAMFRGDRCAWCPETF
jgi:predicted acetyltransferase